MTPREMQNDFEYKVNRYDSELIIDSNVIFHWINEAQEIQVITHYTGNNPYNQSFEQNEKRIDDLRALVIETLIPVDFTSTSLKADSYTAQFPVNYMFTVGEEAVIQFTPSTGPQLTKTVEVYPITTDRYTKEISNPFGKHKMHYENATPLRLVKGSSVELITDGNYSVTNYALRYLKQPERIELDGIDCELPEYMHSHIIDKAVNLYLESIGDPRYSSTKEELSDKE